MEVLASDGTDSAPAVTDAFVVVDTPPPAVRVSLAPQKPKAGEAVKATVTPLAPDIDGDKVSYRVRYLVNGAPSKKQEQDSMVLPADAFVHGDRIVVEVVPFDGELEGPLARAEAAAVNSAPALAGVKVEPAAPTAGDTLSCEPTRAPSDPDGDALVTLVQWEVDGRPMGSAGASAKLNPAQVRPGQKVACRAWVNDGELTSAVVAAAPVEVRSRAPSGVEVALFPAAPRTGDAVRCGALGSPVDADGDAIEIDLEALLDGKRQPKPEIAEGTLKAGQKVECQAVPKDGRERGPLATASAVVGNARPGAPVAKLNHHWPRAGVDELTCDVSTIAKDPEGDKMRYRIEWFKNGSSAGLPGNVRSIPANVLKPGDIWVCRLSAEDGEGEGGAAASAAAVVRPDPEGGASRLLKDGTGADRRAER